MYLTLTQLQRALRHDFGDSVAQLREALTHPSAVPVALRGHATAYERLEFLGDRVLALVVAEMLLVRFPSEKEGALAQRHAALVRREALERIARRINLGVYVILSRGEEDAGGRENPAILADACEAVIGALFINAGFDAARDFIHYWWTPLMEESDTPPKDSKTALQELVQGRGKPLPIYEVLSAIGPAHELIFSVVVKVEGEVPVKASGSSKRLAEQTAARILLERIR